MVYQANPSNERAFTQKINSRPSSTPTSRFTPDAAPSRLSSVGDASDEKKCINPRFGNSGRSLSLSRSSPSARGINPSWAWLGRSGRKRFRDFCQPGTLIPAAETPSRRKREERNVCARGTKRNNEVDGVCSARESSRKMMELNTMLRARSRERRALLFITPAGMRIYRFLILCLISILNTCIYTQSAARGYRDKKENSSFQFK